MTFDEFVPVEIDAGTTDEETAISFTPFLLYFDADPDFGFFLGSSRFLDGSFIFPLDEEGNSIVDREGGEGLATFDPSSDFQFLSSGETTTVSFFGVGIGNIDEFFDDDPDNFNSDDVVILEYQVTVSGLNDPITVGLTQLSGVVVEDTTPSATGSIAWSDPDLADAFLISATSSQSNLGLGGLNVSFTNDGGPDHALTWTYTLTSDELGAGQMATETFTITINDQQGSTVSRDVTINITGTADPIALNLASSDVDGEINGGPGTSDTGNIAFTDPDLNETHVVTSAAAPGNTTNLGTFAAILTDDVGPDQDITWTYTLNAAGAALGNGETATEVFTVTINDGNGSIVTQDVTVAITGVNDPIVLGAVDDTGTITEDGATPGTGTATGAIAFTDADVTDVHIASGAFDPTSSTNATSLGTFQTSVTPTVNGVGGAVTWTYTLDQGLADSLGAGDVVTEVFTITINDQNGDTVTQDVTITINGADDNTPPVITSANTAQVGDLLGDTFHMVTATDAENDQLIFSLEDSGDADLFDIDQDGNLSFAGSIDFANFDRSALDPAFNPGGRTEYNLTVEVSDGEFVTTQALTIEYVGDFDDDGVVDTVDNAVTVANGAQEDNNRDPNQDGFGSAIDFDFNGNFIVDGFDLSIFISLFGSNDAEADFNNNGTVDGFDLNIFIANFGTEIAPSAEDFDVDLV